MTPEEFRKMISDSGLSQCEIAKRIGMSDRAIRKMIAGKGRIMRRTIIAVEAVISHHVAAQAEVCFADQQKQEMQTVGHCVLPD